MSTRAPGSTTERTRAPGARARAGGSRTTGPGVDSAGTVIESRTAPTYTVWRIFRCTTSRRVSGQQIGPVTTEEETK